jgi:superfamily II DNA or RNA helicase
MGENNTHLKAVNNTIPSPIKNKGIELSDVAINAIPEYLVNLDEELRGWLRNYQKEVIGNFWKFLFDEDRFFSFLVLPTGAGKTWTVKSLMKSFKVRGENKKKFIFAVPYIALANQTIAGDEMDFGLWHSKASDNLGSNKLIMVIKTLISRIKTGLIKLDEIDCIFIDEFHQHNTPWFEGMPENVDWIMQQARLHNCKIVGMTGTDYDKDGNPLILPRDEADNHLTSEKYQDIKYFIDYRDDDKHKEEGFLTKLIYKRAVEGGLDTSILKSDNSTLNGLDRESEEELILKSGINEAETIYKHHKAKSIVVCKGIEHANTLMEELNAYGDNPNSTFKNVIRVGVMHSGEGVNSQKVLEQFRMGIINVVLSVDMLTTGVDVPSADMLFLMRVIGSQSMWRQIVGRVLRLYTDENGVRKEFGVVIDVYDTIGYLGGHPLNRPLTKEERDDLDKPEPNECVACGKELKRATIEIVIDIEKQKKFITKECTHPNCTHRDQEEEALKFAECDSCMCGTYIQAPYTKAGYLVHDCDYCENIIKMEKIVEPTLLVAYRDRDDAFDLAKYMLEDKNQKSKLNSTIDSPKVVLTDDEISKYTLALKQFFKWTERDMILSVLEFLTSEYKVNYSMGAVRKILDRVVEKNEEFKTDTSKRSIMIRSLIMQKRLDMIEPVSICFEKAKELGIDTIPNFQQINELIEKEKKIKSRDFNSLLEQWYKKNLK